MLVGCACLSPISTHVSGDSIYFWYSLENELQQNIEMQSFDSLCQWLIVHLLLMCLMDQFRSKVYVLHVSTDLWPYVLYAWAKAGGQLSTDHHLVVSGIRLQKRMPDRTGWSKWVGELGTFGQNTVCYLITTFTRAFCAWGYWYWTGKANCKPAVESWIMEKALWEG